MTFATFARAMSCGARVCSSAARLFRPTFSMFLQRNRNALSRSQFLRAAARNISAMLFAVRHVLLLICMVAAAAAIVAIPAEPASAARQQAPLQLAPAPQTIPPPPASAPQVPAAPVIVLDPAHGGADTGARGPDGVVEKDLVLQIVRTMRPELERRGYRVITTRNDDSNPSYDDRAGIANAYPGAVFVSIHISSTGKPGTVRAYYDRFGSPDRACARRCGPDRRGCASRESAIRRSD